MIRKPLMAVSLALLLLATTLLALAEGDTRPPELVSMTIYPASVNTTLSAQLVTFTVRLTDDLSGVTDGGINGIGTSASQARFVSPSGGQDASVMFSSPQQLVSGDPLDGIYVSTLLLPQFSEGGIWRLDSFYLVDDVGNSQYLFRDDVAAMGFPTEFLVDSVGDTTVPTLVALDFEPKSVDTSSASMFITFTVRLTDDLSGITDGMIGGTSRSPSQIHFASPSGSQFVNVMFSPPQQLVSGDPLDGIYEARMELPQYSQAGIWRLHHFYLVDDVGNSQYLYENEVQALGFPTQFEIVSAGDVAPPVLTDLSFNPDTVNLTGPAQLVTVTVRLTDDLSGITDGMIGGISRSPSQARFVSPTGQQQVYALFAPPHQLVSGDSLDGVYQTTIQLPYYSEGGIWRLESFLLVDDVGNMVTLYQNDLTALGFPTEILVGLLVSPEGEGSLVYNDLENGVPVSALTTTIQVPAGAVSETTLLAYTALPTVSNVPPDQASTNKNFNLDAYRHKALLDHFNFNMPVTVTLNYADGSVLGIDENTLILAYWDGTAWVDISESCPLSVYEREPDQNQLTVSTCHLSQFALLGLKQPGLYLPVILRQ